VYGKRFLLNQAFANLLQNATGFAPVGTSIILSVTKESHQAVVAIEDSGPGLPAYARDKVFERFYSLPRPDTGAKGTVLGLSFVREIAHLHHGEITLENRPTGGCKATLTLPA